MKRLIILMLLVSCGNPALTKEPGTATKESELQEQLNEAQARINTLELELRAKEFIEQSHEANILQLKEKLDACENPENNEEEPTEEGETYE